MERWTERVEFEGHSECSLSDSQANPSSTCRYVYNPFNMPERRAEPTQLSVIYRNLI